MRALRLTLLNWLADHPEIDSFALITEQESNTLRVMIYRGAGFQRVDVSYDNLEAAAPHFRHELAAAASRLRLNG